MNHPESETLLTQYGNSETLFSTASSEQCKALYVNDPDADWTQEKSDAGCCIDDTYDVCKDIARDKLESARQDTYQVFRNIECPCAKAVVVDIMYRFGIDKINKEQTPNFVVAITDRNWNEAADLLLSSGGSEYCESIGQENCEQNA